MKSIFKILLVSVLFFSVVNAQELAPPVELYFITVNAPSSPIITCTLTAQSQCWGDTSGNSTPPGDYFLTDDYDNPVYTPTGNNLGSNSAGFDFVTSQNIVGGVPVYPILAYGIYKVTSNGSNKYFYLDYRDYRIGWYGNYSPSSYGHNIDLWIKYKDDKDSFYYYSGTPDIYHNIADGELLNLWNIKQKGTQLTSLFPSYWGNCLAATNNGSDHPRLVWGPYPGTLQGTITGYRIYRSDAHIPGQQPTNFSLLATVNANVYNYTDNYITMGSDYRARSYYVKCVYEDPWDRINETTPTNTVEVRMQIPDKRSADSHDIKRIVDYNLSQNYPNPFNPVTTIEFTLKENTFVSLRVFDILGREVAVVTNDFLNSGKHQVEFDGQNLVSGIYFYELKTDKYRDVKKLILLK